LLDRLGPEEIAVLEGKKKEVQAVLDEKRKQLKAVQTGELARAILIELTIRSGSNGCTAQDEGSGQSH
jgi:hypothetical protein